MATIFDTNGGRLPVIVQAKRTVTHEVLRELLPDILDEKAAAILRSGAELHELQEAIAWAGGQSGVMGELRRPLSGSVAVVYDILTSDLGPEERERD